MMFYSVWAKSKKIKITLKSSVNLNKRTQFTESVLYSLCAIDLIAAEALNQTQMKEWKRQQLF